MKILRAISFLSIVILGFGCEARPTHRPDRQRAIDWVHSIGGQVDFEIRQKGGAYCEYSLDLTESAVSDTDLKRFECFGLLKELDLDQTGVTSEGFKDLDLVFRCLSVSQTEINDTMFLHYILMSYLESLDISSTGVTGKSLFKLAESARALSELDISYTKVQPCSLKAVLGFKYLGVLKLNGLPLSSKDLGLLESICRIRSLRVVELEGTLLSESDIVGLRSRLGAAGPLILEGKPSEPSQP